MWYTGLTVGAAICYVSGPVSLNSAQERYSYLQACRREPRGQGLLLGARVVAAGTAAAAETAAVAAGAVRVVVGADNLHVAAPVLLLYLQSEWEER